MMIIESSKFKEALSSPQITKTVIFKDNEGEDGYGKEKVF